MKGLIKKDFIILAKKIKPITRIIIAAIILLLLIYLRSSGAIFIAILLPVGVASLPITLITIDEQAQWDKYAISLPVTKQMIVASRYLSCEILLFLCSLFSVTINIAMGLIFNEYSMGLHLSIAIIGLLIAMLYTLVILPANYFFGVNGGSTVMIGLMIIITGAAYIFKKINITLSIPTAMQIGTVIGIAAVVIIGLSFVSFITSEKIYEKKHS